MYYDYTTLITDVHESNVLMVSRHVVRCEVLSVIEPKSNHKQSKFSVSFSLLHGRHYITQTT